RQLAELGGREIEIGIFDSAFQLVGPIPGNKNQRDMRLDYFDTSNASAVRGGILQKRDNVLLIIRHWYGGWIEALRSRCTRLRLSPISGRASGRAALRGLGGDLGLHRHAESLRGQTRPR